MSLKHKLLIHEEQVEGEEGGFREIEGGEGRQLVKAKGRGKQIASRPHYLS